MWGFPITHWFKQYQLWTIYDLFSSWIADLDFSFTQDVHTDMLIQSQFKQKLLHVLAQVRHFEDLFCEEAIEYLSQQFTLVLLSSKSV